MNFFSRLFGTKKSEDEPKGAADGDATHIDAAQPARTPPSVIPLDADKKPADLASSDGKKTRVSPPTPATEVKEKDAASDLSKTAKIQRPQPAAPAPKRPLPAAAFGAVRVTPADAAVPTAGPKAPPPRTVSTKSDPSQIARSGTAPKPPLPQPRKVLAPAPEPAQIPKTQDDFLGDLLLNLDESFDSIIGEQEDNQPGSKTVVGEPSAQDSDRLAVLELFYDIATNHLRPVRNFMIEVHLGDVRKEWLQIAGPAIASILSAAEQIGIPELQAKLQAFSKTIDQAEQSSADRIGAHLREALIAQYQTLADFMPRAFTLDHKENQRESLITHSLLLQIPDVRKVTIDKLYRAGLTGLEVLFLATTEDLAATTGIRKLLAQRIVEKFQNYRKQTQGFVPDVANVTEISTLDSLIGTLKAQQEAYNKAAAIHDLAEKRGHRLARQGTLLEITVVLARLGETKFVEELERLAMEMKIEALASYLEKSRTSAAQARRA
jgi:hypothetical protein